MKDDTIYVRHILDAISKIETYLDGKSRDDLLKDSLLLDGTVRELEIIGEAANQCSETMRNDNPNIPFALIIGMRNRLIHEYFEVDINIVWETYAKNLPALKKELKTLL